ncbi:MAG: hypothetical protein JWM68_2292 [Verrucomicrobiales bacterium]|nr:hypothetical protein [Verrucomicrobiales bacterium]
MSNYSHKFVEFMPEKLEPGVIYVSLRFALVSHQCACGCGEEVVTPLSPKDWQLIFNGETISLYPSIGNWKFQCGSHYWIDQNRAVWASKWKSSNEIDDEDEKSERTNAPMKSITDRLWERLKRRWY